MILIQRIQNLLLQPRVAWRRIDEVSVSAGPLWRQLLLLAAIPAVCSCIGMAAVGAGSAGLTVHLPWVAGLAQAAAIYLLLVLGVWLLALVMAIVAPTFGGNADRLRAFSLAVHASSAVLLAGVFLLVPPMAPLMLVGALYSVYLVFTGLPVLMRSAPQKTAPYTAVIVLAGAVAGLLVSSAISYFTLGSAVVKLHTPGGKLALDAQALGAASQKMADAAERMEAASERQAGAQPPATSTPPLIGGDPDAGAVPAPALKAALPEMLGAFRRTAIEMQGGHMAGRATSNARADYVRDEQRLRIEMLDLGSMSKLMAEAGAVVQGERENGQLSERTWQENGRTLHESFRKDGSQAQYTTTLRNGVVVELTGQKMSLDEVKAASSLLDLATLEGLQRQSGP
ncbi:Yip1 family protein [Xylophilus sp. ASV27]|uniref:Yip1 family protein n=1 Tax=Xylophilus sp. ASV27 TaxID=2795129 RepID=UPI0018EA65D5|nr:Yip1 family protein [Xylophilus sp. ASV27]